jgi:hypothetical protein
VPEVTGRPAYHPATLLSRSGRIYPGLCCCAGLAFDPANKLEALAVFRKNLPNISEILPTSRMRSCFIRQRVSRAAPSSTWKA